MCRVSGSTLYESFIGFQLQLLCSAFAECSRSLLSCFEKKKVYVIASLDQYSDGFNLSHSDNFLYSWPSGYLKHTRMTALPCLRCFSGGDFPVTGWSAGNKFTDVLMAEGWGTKEWWIKPLGHWQNNRVRFFVVLLNLIRGATNADSKKLYFSSAFVWALGHSVLSQMFISLPTRR